MVVDASAFQVIPLTDVKTVPAAPTATNRPPPKQTDRSELVVVEVRLVHVTPSGDVTMAPESPTTAYNPAPYAAPLNDCVVADTRDTQGLWVCASSFATAAKPDRQINKHEIKWRAEFIIWEGESPDTGGRRVTHRNSFRLNRPASI